MKLSKYFGIKTTMSDALKYFFMSILTFILVKVERFKTGNLDVI